MILENPFETEGKWYKGNLHTHTTGSDGEKSPAEIVAHYREQGYDFIALTDHGKVTDIAGLSSDDFLVLPGAELGASGAELNYSYHIVAVNVGEVDGLSSDMDAQEIIHAINEQGGLAIVAHPYWSVLTIRDLMRLKGHIGIEVYNTSCDYSIGKGHSMVHWDALLSQGRNVWGVAADDVHWHFNDHRPVDACGGWVMVKARGLTEQNIVSALRAGQFYASSGPTIEDIAVTDDSVVATVSESRTIQFISDGGRGEAFTDPKGKPITSAEFTPKGKEKFLRIQTITPDGQMAWTNPLWVSGR